MFVYTLFEKRIINQREKTMDAYNSTLPPPLMSIDPNQIDHNNMSTSGLIIRNNQSSQLHSDTVSYILTPEKTPEKTALIVSDLHKAVI